MLNLTELLFGLARGRTHWRPLSEHRYRGKSQPRVDMPAKVTGGAIFVQYLNPKGAVFGAIVRPPTCTARLLQANTAAIENMAGVLKVLRNGSFLGIVAEREDQALAAATALAASAKWDVESALPGNKRIFEWLTIASSEESDFLDKDCVTDDAPANVFTSEVRVGDCSDVSRTSEAGH